MSTALAARCSVCGLSVPPGRAHCGQAPSLGAAPPKVRGPGFGQGRRKPVKKVNKERKAKLRMAAFSDCARLARLLPCCVPSCRQPPPSDPAHVRSRGAGGKDRANVVSLCRLHHNQAHQIGVETFQSRHNFSLEVVAGRVAELVDAHTCEEWPALDQSCAPVCGVCQKRIADEGARTP